VEHLDEFLAAMLREQGLPTAPIFTVPETTLDADGRLPADAVERLRSWLRALASDARARSIVVGQTLRGAVDSLSGRTAELVVASRDQHDAAVSLRKAVDESFDEAHRRVDAGMTDGTLLRGEVLARWQEFVGTGDFFRQIESTISRWRDKLTAAVKGNPPPDEGLGEALQSGVAALLLSNAETAASETARAWRRLPGGSQILTAHPDLAKPAPGLRPDVERLVRDWQGEVLELVRTEGQGRRTNARIAAYGLNAIGLFLMLVAFSSTAGLTGAEIGIAGGTAVLAQRVLEAIFGDQAVREMAAKARRSLLDLADHLYSGERERYAAALAEVAPPADQAQRLSAVAAGLRAVVR